MLSGGEIPRYLGYVLWIMSQMSRVVGDAPQRPAAPFELGTRGLADIQRLGVTWNLSWLMGRYSESNGVLSCWV